jgi:hypothetical protein
VPQTPSAYRSQTKIVLDVGGLHFAPSMTIILTVHALHCLKWSIGRQMGRSSKMMLSLNVMGTEETFGILILM